MFAIPQSLVQRITSAGLGVFIASVAPLKSQSLIKTSTCADNHGEAKTAMTDMLKKFTSAPFVTVYSFINLSYPHILREVIPDQL